MSARDDFPILAALDPAFGGVDWEANVALDEIDRLRADLDHARLAFNADLHCTPAERDLIHHAIAEHGAWEQYRSTLFDNDYHVWRLMHDATMQATAVLAQRAEKEAE